MGKIHHCIHCMTTFNTSRQLLRHNFKLHKPLRLSRSIYTKLLETKFFHDSPVQVYGKHPRLFFNINNICKVTGLSSNTKSIDKTHITQCKKFISEDGLYDLIYASNSNVEFKLWIRNTIRDIRESYISNLHSELKHYKEKTYEQVEKTGYVYILSTDIEGIYKCGRTKSTVNKRVKGLQTGNVKDIEILYQYHTSHDILLESLVHSVFDKYRTNSNREHFCCSLEYMKRVIQHSGGFIDTIRSTFQSIDNETIIEKCKQVFEDNKA